MKLDRIFIGYDAREAEMYKVCEDSIKRNCPLIHKPIIMPLIQEELRGAGIYWRAHDEMAATAFSNTRFLTPYLSDYNGWSLFMDCDMLITADIQEIMEYADNKYAVCVVKHDYTPKKTVKMDGCVQKALPRKNWSSVMLFNCGHPSTKNLTPDFISTVNAGILHRFEWCKDEEIGELPIEWNWLEGEYEKPDKLPKNIHYTNGHFFLGNKTEYEQELIEATAISQWDRELDRIGNVLLTPTFEECLARINEKYGVALKALGND